MNGVFIPEISPMRATRIWIAAVEYVAGEDTSVEGIFDGRSANIARLNQPCLRPPRWSDPQVRRMFCLPGLRIAVLDARCVELDVG